MSTEPSKDVNKGSRPFESWVSRCLKRLKSFGLVLPICGLVAVLFFSGSAIHYTSGTQFCVVCHEMDSAVQSWQTSSHGSNELGIVVQCKDCHIPNGTFSLLTTKVRNLKQPFIHFVQAPSPFEYSLMQPGLAKQARKEIQDDKCLECHNLQEMEPKTQNQIMAHSTAVGITNCTSCHNAVGHSIKQKEGVF